MQTYHRPDTVDEALKLLASGELRVAAGCTDLFPLTQERALPWPVLDITNIKALRGITQTDTGWRIGGATTWTDILRADLPPVFDGLKLAGREVGSVQIQNSGTIAGNLCTASPAGDGIPCLMILDASVELASVRGNRVLPLEEFLTRARQTALKSDELLTAVHVPDLPGQSDFTKLGARAYLVISIAMVASRVVIDGGAIKDVAISVGACSAVAARLRGLETALIGCSVDQVLRRITTDMIAESLSPIDDIRADAAYRIIAAEELVRRSLDKLITQAKELA